MQTKVKHWVMMTLIGILLISTVFIYGCGSKNTNTSGSNENAPKKDIVIGVVGSFSGPGAVLGKSLRNGVEIAMEKINSAGGVNGRKIVAVYRDDELDPTKSRNAVEELISKEKVIAIIGPTSTSAALAVQPVMTQNKIMQMNGAILGNDIIDLQKYPYSFRTVPNSSHQAEAMVNYAVKVRGWKKIAIITDTSAVSIDGSKDLKKFLSKEGLTPVIETKYTQGEKDMTAQAGDIKKAQPDAILVWPYPQDAAVFMKALEKIDFLPPKTNVIGNLGICSSAFGSLAGEAGKDVMGIHLASYAFSADKPISESAKKFAEVVAKIDPAINPGTVGTWHDGMMILGEAWKKVGTDDPDKVKQAIEAITNYQGISAIYNFGPNDHEGAGVENAKVVIVSKRENGAYLAAPAK